MVITYLCHIRGGGDLKARRKMQIVPTDEAVIRISCAGEQTLFVTSSGGLYLGRSGGEGGERRGTWTKLDTNGIRVRDAAVHNGDIFTVTENGDVLVRPLGIEKEDSGTSHGVFHRFPLEEPGGKCPHGQERRGQKLRVRKLVSGGGLERGEGKHEGHLAILSSRGEIWLRGGGKAMGAVSSRLGPHEETTGGEATCVNYLKGRHVSDVSAGAGFSLALVEPLDTPSDPSGGRADSCLSCTEGEGGVTPRSRSGDGHGEEEDKRCPLGLSLSPRENDSGSDTSSTKRRTHRPSDGSEFEVVEVGEEQAEESIDLEEEEGDRRRDGEGDTDKKLDEESAQGKSLFLNADAARQFISRQLSWMTSSAGEEAPLPPSLPSLLPKEEKGPSTSSLATDIIRENVANAATLVVSGVRTVGHKVGKLSRHFSGTEVEIEGQEVALEEGGVALETLGPGASSGLDPGVSQNTSHSVSSSPLVPKTSYATHSLPRRLSEHITRRAMHVRTSSGGGMVSFRRGVTVGSPYSPEDFAALGRRVLNTEVWAWGAGDRGQLGTGDLTDRTTPSCVYALNHLGIVKVVCGESLAAAITLDGQVYVWGESPASNYVVSPQRLHLPREEEEEIDEDKETEAADEEKALAVDIGTGGDYLIVVTAGGRVLYVGKVGDEDAVSIRHFPVGDFTTKCTSVLAHGDNVVCASSHVQREVAEFLQEEKSYLSLLNFCLLNLLKAFLPLPSQGENKHIQEAKKRLSSAFENLVYAVAASVTASSSSFTPCLLAIITQVEPMKAIYHLYVKAACDALAVGCLTPQATTAGTNAGVQALLDACRSGSVRLRKGDQMRKWVMSSAALSSTSSGPSSTSFFSSTSSTSSSASFFSSASSTSTASSTSSSASSTMSSQTSDVIRYVLLTRPLERLREYETFSKHVMEEAESLPQARDLCNVAHSHWRIACNNASRSQIEAEQSRSFWETSPQLRQALMTPEKRVIRESRTHPLTLQNAGRFTSFSTHSFVLMSDALVHVQYSSFVTYPLQTMWVEPVPQASNMQNAILVTLPEETLTLLCPTSLDKSQWLYALQEAIKRSVLPPDGAGVAPRSPPLVRNATYTFGKVPYKEAVYTGQWLCGKMHGQGTMKFPDGSYYVGRFRQGLYHGAGTLYIPSSSSSSSSSSSFARHEGNWVAGKLVGHAVIRHANGDLYTGQVKSGQPWGHGVLKKGKFGSQAPSVYTGEWMNGLRHGYGVLDDIVQGEKYMGMWHNDTRHGPGMVVTMNGVYYEGNFNHNKLTGHGLMLFEDNTSYEGELGAMGSLAGKGILTYPTGDSLEGNFSGAWPDAVKVNGLLRRGTATSMANSGVGSLPRNFGKHSVAAERKWEAVIKICEEQLGVNEAEMTLTKLWERLASRLHEDHQSYLQSFQRRKENGEAPKDDAERRTEKDGESIDGLDHIPVLPEVVDLKAYRHVKDYLAKAFISRLHPLGRLLHGLADAFRATYGGVVAHPRLLPYAVQEVHSLTLRTYRLVRTLFPLLPEERDSVMLEREEGEEEEEEEDSVIVTPRTLLQPWLLQPIYSPLSSLYVLANHPKDEEYWRRLATWNKQPDDGLLTFLGVDTKFWHDPDEALGTGTTTRRPSGSAFDGGTKSRENHFAEAVETLQLISTAFSPRDKLGVIRQTFQRISEVVTTRLGHKYLWTMDDLFPVVQYVVVRSRIQHLGAEIHFVEDLMDDSLHNGELGLMFTTLKACYYQIQNEKVSYP